MVLLGVLIRKQRKSKIFINKQIITLPNILTLSLSHAKLVFLSIRVRLV